MENKLKHYLLGSLSEEEIEEIDLRIISGKISEEQLSIAEDNLMEDFLEETLSPPETELFYKNFLVTDERKCDLQHFFLLKKYVQNIIGNEITSKPETLASANFFEKLKRLFNLNLRLVTAAFAFLILGLAISLYFYNSGNKEVAGLNERDLSNLSEYTNLSAISLIPGAYRDSTETKNLSAAQLTDRVLFQLALPVEVGSESVFNARIIKEQTVVSTLNKIPAYKNQGGRELRLILPASLLKKGDYKIEVAPENAKAVLIVYPFAIR
jgi:hypothetical protein